MTPSPSRGEGGARRNRQGCENAIAPLPGNLIPAFLSFLAVGSLGFVVDAGGCAALIAAGMPPLAARLPSILAAMATTFLLNRRVTFCSSGPLAGEAARYVAVCAAGACLNYSVFALALWGCPTLPPILALALGTATALAWNFSGSRGLVFTRPPGSAPCDPAKA